MADEKITVHGQRTITTFQKRFLKFEFIGGVDNAGRPVVLTGNKENRLIIEGLRASVDIDIFGSRILPSATIEIVNADMSLANAISSVGLYSRERLTVTTQVIVWAASIEKDDQEPVYSKVFEGGILDSYLDLNAAPDYTLHIIAKTLATGSSLPLQSIAFDGAVKVVDIVNAIVKNQNNQIKDSKYFEVVKVVNHGVETALNNPNFSGSMVEQLDQCKQAAGFEYSITDKILSIFPQDGGIPENKTVHMSKVFGQIGYPKYSNGNIIIESVFIPSIKFGQAIRINNSLYENANGIWPNMVSLQHRLNTLTPSASWHTIIQLAKINKRNSS